MMNDQATRRIAFYRRTAAEVEDGGPGDSNLAALDRRLKETPGAILAGDYEDNAVSGLLPLADRPAGAHLCRDAKLAHFDEIWAHDFPTLGRRVIDTLDLADFFAEIGITLDVLETPQRSAGADR